MSWLDGIGQLARFGKFAEELLRDDRQQCESFDDCLQRVIAESRQWRELGASKPEPMPQNADGPAVWPMVIEYLAKQDDPVFARMAQDARKRHEFGVKKYGVPLVASNGRNHLADAYQEALDMVVYLWAYHESTGLGWQLVEIAIGFCAGLLRAMEAK